MLVKLNDILGQKQAIETIGAAYASDRLPHGLIFAVVPGVGKATTAAALAALFLCDSPGGLQPCGKCPSCLAFAAAASVHPDYHVITKELVRVYDKTGKSKAVNLSIDVIRQELVAAAGRKTSLGRGKVFVIEQAELMTAAAQNAMLKTLEEPPGRTLIVLLSEQVSALLPTIRSRCQIVRFCRLDEALVRQELQRRGIDAATAGAAAQLCDGSIGVALRWIADGVIAPAAELAGRIDALLAGGDAGDLSDWLRAAADAYAEKQLARDELASKDAAVRDGLSLYLSLAAGRLRKSMPACDDSLDLDRLCAAVDAVDCAQTYLDANVNVPVALQQLAMALSGP